MLVGKASRKDLTIKVCSGISLDISLTGCRNLQFLPIISGRLNCATNEEIKSLLRKNGASWKM